MRIGTSIITVVFFLIISFSFGGIFSCDDDDDDDDDFEDDDGDDDDGGGDWYDEGASAYDNCVAFYTMYYECFGMTPDLPTIETLCSGFDGFEDLYSDDQCWLDALDAYWACFGKLKCDDFDSYTDFGNAIAECTN